MWYLVPWPEIKPGPSTLEAWSLSHWTNRDVPPLPRFLTPLPFFPFLFPSSPILPPFFCYFHFSWTLRNCKACKHSYGEKCFESCKEGNVSDIVSKSTENHFYLWFYCSWQAKCILPHMPFFPKHCKTDHVSTWSVTWSSGAPWCTVAEKPF